MENKNVLVTGCCGFIGAATCHGLKDGDGYNIFGLDNNISGGMNNSRRRQLFDNDIYSVHVELLDQSDLMDLDDACSGWEFDAVIHLAAIPGVRESLIYPERYYQNNFIGTLNILKLMRKYKIPKLVFASTSSVYDWNNAPYKPIGEQTSYIKSTHPYAGSKLAAEDLCRMYHELYGIDVSILRLFTVYGPSGRPDMFPLRCIKWLIEGEPIKINGNGNQLRDFTYIDDVTDAIIKALEPIGCETFNIGKGTPWNLNAFISMATKAVYGNDETKHPVEIQPSNKLDVSFTWADNSKAREMLNWEPKTGLEEGIQKTVDWYQENREVLKGII